MNFVQFASAVKSAQLLSQHHMLSCNLYRAGKKSSKISPLSVDKLGLKSLGGGYWKNPFEILKHKSFHYWLPMNWCWVLLSYPASWEKCFQEIPKLWAICCSVIDIRPNLFQSGLKKKQPRLFFFFSFLLHFLNCVPRRGAICRSVIDITRASNRYQIVSAPLATAQSAHGENNEKGIEPVQDTENFQIVLKTMW